MAPTAAKTAARAGDAGAPATAAAGKSGKPAYTWQQVAEHNTAASAWVIMEGNVYDLTGFIDVHPGGRDMLLLAAGREVTDLFKMYHVFNEERARRFLAPYAIGTVTGEPEFPQYKPEAPGGFYATLKQRVIAHFKATGKDPKSPLPGLLRIVPTIAAFICVFLLMHDRLVPGLPWLLKLCVLAPLFGVLQALPLMHWLHDSSHGSIGWSQWWWRTCGFLTMDLLAGGSTLPWAHQHIIGHHVMTNVFQADPDLPVAAEGDMRRLVPAQAWQALYKYQHVYLPILYGLLGMKIRIQDITEYLFRRMNGPVRVNWFGDASAAYLRILGPKVAWAVWRIGVPLLLWRVPVGQFLALFMVGDIVTGYWLAYNFQVSHITEDVAWPNGGDSKSMQLEDTWAENQVKTSLDYDHESAVTRYLSGALNYQIEHHLFPGISQYHYADIAPIVKRTCAEFGLPYRYEPTFARAFWAHIGYLKAMGQAGKAAHMD